MRSLLSRILLVLALLSPAYAEENQRKLTVEDVLSETKGGPKDAGAAAGATNSEAVSDEATTFNGVKVPPMKELNGNDFDKDTKDGYWYVVTTGLSRRPRSTCTDQWMVQVRQALLALLSPLHSYSASLANVI